MNILHVIAQYPDRTGSGVSCKNMINSIHHNFEHHQAVIYGINPDQRKPEFPITEYPVVFEQDNLPFPVVGMSDVMAYRSTAYKDMTAEQMRQWKAAFNHALDEAINESKPDIIFVHHLWILCSLVMERDIPTLAICHGTDLRQAGQNPDIFKDHVKNLDKLNQVAALTHSQVADLMEVYGLNEKQIFVSGGAYDPSIFYAEEMREPRDTVELAYVGKISDAKGSLELIEAFRQIPDKDVRLSMLGSVEEDMEERYAVAVGDDQRINTYMPNSQREMADILRTKDVFVFPSLYEGLGLVALEAMASGLCLVVTDLPNLRNFVGSEIWLNDDVSVVEMPRLKNLDELVAEDRPNFLKNLTLAMQEQIKRTRNREIRSNLIDCCNDFTWDALTRLIVEHAEDILA